MSEWKRVQFNARCALDLDECLVPVDGYACTVLGVEGFCVHHGVHLLGGYWRVSHMQTGLACDWTDKNLTREAAVQYAEKKLLERGEGDREKAVGILKKVIAGALADPSTAHSQRTRPEATA